MLNRGKPSRSCVSVVSCSVTEMCVNAQICFALPVLYRGKPSQNCMSSTSFSNAKICVNAQICSRHTCYTEICPQSRLVYILSQGENSPTSTQGKYTLTPKIQKPTLEHNMEKFPRPHSRENSLKSKIWKPTIVRRRKRPPFPLKEVSPLE